MCWLSLTTMVEDCKLHKIFLTNPKDLLQYLGCYVEIILSNGEVILGTVYTIDPVSQSLIIISKQDSGEISLKLILHHCITSMKILTNTPQEEMNILNDIFPGSTSTGHNKTDVKLWLEKNMIPVTEDGDKLIIESAEICPPYGIDQCYSSNSIVLSRIQKLIKEMPTSH